MNPLVWYVGAAAAIAGMGSLFLYWYNPFVWTGPQMPLDRSAPLERGYPGDEDDGRDH